MLLGPVEFGVLCFLFVVLVVQIRLWMERSALRRREKMIADAREIFHSESSSLEQKGHIGVGLAVATRPSLPILLAVFAVGWLFSPGTRGDPGLDMKNHEVAQLTKLYGDHIIPVNFRVAWPWYLLVGTILLPILLTWLLCYAVKHHFGVPLRRALTKVRHAFEVSIYIDNDRRLRKGGPGGPTSSSSAA